MNIRVLIVTAATVPLLMTATIVVAAAAVGTPDLGSCAQVAAPQTSGGAASPSTRMRQLTTVQRNNARIIYDVGIQLRAPYRGAVIAIATALQESSLINQTVAKDHDSLGLFQQRPSQGWGTPSQITDPVYSSTAFYTRLKRVDRWEQLALTDAAQKVQRSAYPDAYAKWEPLATELADDAAAVTGKVIGRSTAELDCSSMTPGTAEPAPRNSDGTWPYESCTIRPDPTTGTGCVTPRLLHLIQQTSDAGFPKPGCYRVDNHGEHPKGRACDFMMTAGGEAAGAQKTRGDVMAAWLVANADRLGIKYVIWFRKIWTPTQGWHAYNNPWGGDDPSGWHTNHVHISVE